MVRWRIPLIEGSSQIEIILKDAVDPHFFTADNSMAKCCNRWRVSNSGGEIKIIVSFRSVRALLIPNQPYIKTVIILPRGSTTD